MPDLISAADWLRATLGGPLALAAGGLMLLFGRRLYWLVAGVIGFVVIFVLCGRLLPELSPQVAFWFSLAAGVVGAVLVVFAHKTLLGIVGGLGGALVALWHVQHLGVERGVAWLLAAIVGGLLGAWMVSKLFEMALVLLSSLFGAQLLLDAWPVDLWQLPADGFLLAYWGLVAFGLFFQLVRSKQRQRRRRRRSED